MRLSFASASSFEEYSSLERSLSVLSKKSAGCRMLLASAVKRA